MRGRASGDFGGELDVGELDLAHHAPRLARIDQACAETARGLRAARDAEAQALVWEAPFVAGCEITGEEGIARAALGDRLAGLYARVLEPWLSVDEHLGKAAI